MLVVRFWCQCRWGFRSSVYDVASLDSRFPTFRNKVMDSYSRVEMYKKISFWRLSRYFLSKCRYRLSVHTSSYSVKEKSVSTSIGACDRNRFSTFKMRDVVHFTSSIHLTPTHTRLITWHYWFRHTNMFLPRYNRHFNCLFWITLR